MNAKSTFQRLLVVFVLSVVLIVSTNTFVSAQLGGQGAGFIQNEVTTDASINAVPEVPGGPGFIMVSAFAFRPFYSFSQDEYTGSGLYNPNIGGSGIYGAGLTLPDRSKITKFTIYFKDNEPSGQLTAFLYSGDASATLITLSTISTAGISSPDFQALSAPLNLEVDNQNLSYSLFINISGNVSPASIILSNVRIDYEYTTVAPLVMN